MKYSNTARLLPPMERCASSEIRRSKSVGENSRLPIFVVELQALVGVSRSHEEFDDGGGGQRLSGAGGHFKQKARLAFANGSLKRPNCTELVRTKELQSGIFDECVLLRGIVPSGIVPVVRILSCRNVIGLDLFADQSIGVRLERVKVSQRIRRRELGYQDGVALLKVPEVMQIAVGQDDKPDILRMGVFPGLILADKRIKLFGFRFEDGYREAAFLQQEVINVAARGSFEVVAEGIKGLFL